MAEQLRMEAVVVDHATGPLKKIREQIESVRMTPHIKELQEGFGHLREHAEGLAKQGDALTASFAGVGIASLAASVSVAELIKGYRELAQHAVELRALSHETGLTADTINQLQHAAADFGVSQDTVSKSLSTWADKMFDFKRGVGELRAELNTQFPDVAKRMDLETPIQQLHELENLIAGMANDPIRQKRWSELVFGNGDMARMFADGMKPFNEAIEDAQKRLGKITPELQQQALELNRSILAFSDSLDKLETKTGPFVFKELKLAADDFKAAFESVEKAVEWFQKLRKDPAGTVKEGLNAADDAFNKKAEEVGKRWKDNAGTGSQHGEDGNSLRRNDEMSAGLLHKSAYTTFDRAAPGALGSVSPGLQQVIQIGTRAGVLQGLLDFSLMKDAESRAKGGGSGLQSASYEEWDTGGGSSPLGRFGGRGRSAAEGAKGQYRDGGVGQPHATTAQQRKNAAESWNFWKSQGYSDAAASGMLAMEQGESNFDPAARGDPDSHGVKTAHGLFQWHQPRRDLIQKGTGIDVDRASHLDQLKAAQWEMTHGQEAEAGVAIRRSRTPEEAAHAGVYFYERPLNKAADAARRSGMARSWAQRYAHGTGIDQGQDAVGSAKRDGQTHHGEDRSTRAGIWDLQRRAGMGGQQSIKTEGGFHGTIEFKGGPEVKRTNVRLDGLMDSVKIKRGPTMTTPSYDA